MICQSCSLLSKLYLEKSKNQGKRSEKLPVKRTKKLCDWKGREQNEWKSRVYNVLSIVIFLRFWFFLFLLQLPVCIKNTLLYQQLCKVSMPVCHIVCAIRVMNYLSVLLSAFETLFSEEWKSGEKEGKAAYCKEWRNLVIEEDKNERERCLCVRTFSTIFLRFWYFFSREIRLFGGCPNSSDPFLHMKDYRKQRKSNTTPRGNFGIHTATLSASFGSKKTRTQKVFVRCFFLC